MAFKGNLPSDLWLKYNKEGGRHLMELDMHISIEINDRIAEATSKAQKTKPGAGNIHTLTGDDASEVIKRRNERRAARQKQQQDLSDS
jgi:hypothetical protein